MTFSLIVALPLYKVELDHLGAYMEGVQPCLLLPYLNCLGTYQCLFYALATSQP